MARLRSQGPVMTAMESLSKGPSRKRRTSTPPVSPRQEEVSSATLKRQSLNSALRKTPQKQKKRVRFSDPGPESFPTNNSGLTPYIARTTISFDIDETPPENLRLLARPPKRRLSMPDLRGLEKHETAVEPIEILQFTPLRQILTPRTRRQLRRNHLSEEMNNIEAEERSVSKLQQEIQSLKNELTLAKQLSANSEENEKELNVQRIQELEKEIVELKRERSSSIDSDLSLVADTTFIADTDSVDLLPSESDCGTLSPGFNAEDDIDITFPSSPSPVADVTADVPNFVKVSTAAIQTDITSQSLSTLYSYAQSQTKSLSHARLELERLFPGETTLSLPLSGDANPLLDNMLSRLKDSTDQLSTCRASLVASQTQESNLRAKFNTSLKQLEEARASHARLIAESQKSASARMTCTDEKLAKLEVEVRNYETNHERTTAALDKYREDVNNLQGLIQTLEIEHAGTIAKLQSEKEEAVMKAKAEVDEAVADLECMVAAETRGRREAESKCDELSLKAREAKEREREAKQALNEKQKIVRELEGTIEDMRQAWEKEVGGLNARVGQLCADVEHKKHELWQAEDEVRRLAGCVHDEKDAAERSMSKMMAEISKCKDAAGKVGDDFTKDAETRNERVISALGLLTPTVEGGRFRDVNPESESLEGRVEMVRGKSKRRKVDSGIGILAEDEEEE